MNSIQHFVPITYDSIAEMTSDTLLKVGMIAKTMGYYEPGDGGGAYYKIIDTSHYPDGTYVSDMGSIFDLQDSVNLKAILMTESTTPVSVAQFGAKGDGINDDSVAINRCLSLYDNIVFGRNKTYCIGSPITNLYKKHIDMNLSSLIAKGDNQIISLRKNYDLNNDIHTIGFNTISDTVICNGFILTQNGISLTASPIDFNDTNYSCHFDHIVFGVDEASDIIVDSMPFINSKTNNNYGVIMTFENCRFFNCGKVANLYTNGVRFLHCTIYDTYYGFEVFENINGTDIFENVVFESCIANKTKSPLYAFKVHDNTELRNVSILNISNPFIIADNGTILMESVDVLWNKDYIKRNDIETAYILMIENPSNFDTTDMPIVIAYSYFAYTEEIAHMQVKFSNIDYMICSNNKNTFQSIINSPLPDSLISVMQFRSDESPKIMTRYSKYSPTESSMGKVRYRPYFGINRFASDINYVKSHAGFNCDSVSFASVQSSLYKIEYNFFYKFPEMDENIDNSIIEEITGYYVTIPKNAVCETVWLSKVDDINASIRTNNWYHVCYYVIFDYNTESINAPKFSSVMTILKNDETTQLEVSTQIEATVHKLLSTTIKGINESPYKNIVRYDMLIRFNDSDNVFEKADSSSVTTSIMFNSTVSQEYGVGQITMSEINPDYCLNYNFEDLTSIFTDFSNPQILENNDDFGNINFVSVNNCNLSGFISNNLGLSDVKSTYKRISSIPWIYHAPYFSEIPYEYNMENILDVEIQPMVDGIYVTRRTSAMISGINMVNFKYQFNYETTFYLNADIETNGIADYDGHIMVFIDDIFRYSWPHTDKHKKSFTVSTGFHNLRIFIPLAYNDLTPGLKMSIKNFFITESPNEEIYSVDVVPNVFYSLPLYKNGYVGVYPIKNNQLPYTRGQVDVVYASDYKTVINTNEVSVERLIINNATIFNESLNMYGLNVDINTPVLPSITFYPANVTDPTLAWESSLPSIATVIDGYIHGLSSGIAILTAKCGQVSVQFFVNSQIFPISLEFESLPDNMMIARGSTYKLTVLVNPNNCTINTTIKFQSSNPSIIDVNENGLMTCRDIGDTVITATLSSNNIKGEPITLSTPPIHSFVALESISVERVSGFVTGDNIVDTILNDGAIGTFKVSFYPEDTTESRDIIAEIISRDDSVILSSLTTSEIGMTRNVNIIETGFGWNAIRIRSANHPDIYKDVNIFVRIPSTGISVLYNGEDEAGTMDYTNTMDVVYSLIPENTTDKLPVFNSYLTGAGSSGMSISTISNTMSRIVVTRPGIVSINTIVSKLNYTSKSYIENDGGIYTRSSQLTVEAMVESIDLSISRYEFNNRNQTATMNVTYTPEFATEWDTSNLVVTIDNYSDNESIIVSELNHGTYTITSMDNGIVDVTVDFIGSKSNHRYSVTKQLIVNVTDSHYRPVVFANEVTEVADRLNSMNANNADTFDMVFMNGLMTRASDVNTNSHNSLSTSHVSNVLELSKAMTDGLDMIVIGGDSIYPLSSASSMTTVWNSIDIGPKQVFDKIRPYASYLVGNTDRNDANHMEDGKNMSNYTISLEQLYTDRYTNNNASVDSGKGWWYKDNDTRKVRVIGINPHDRVDWSSDEPYEGYGDNTQYYRGFSQEQVMWFINTALGTTPNDYTTLIVSSFGLHESTAPDYTIGAGMNTDYFNADVMMSAIIAFKNKSTLSINASDYVRSGEFSRYALTDINHTYNNGSDRIAIISGGLGYDFRINVAGINHIVTGYSLGFNPTQEDEDKLQSIIDYWTEAGYSCQGTYNSPRIDTDAGSSNNTYLEDCFDIVHIDNSTNIITLVRFGCGAVTRRYAF